MSSFNWYSSTPEAARIAPDVAEQAVEWLMALQEGRPSAHLLAQWQQWREQHPDHERAWQRIEAVKGNLQPLFSPLNAPMTQATLTQAALAPRQARRRAIKAMAVLMVMGAAGYGVQRALPGQQADYRTRIGERRKLALPDGSELVLNTDSAIQLRFTGQERRIILLAGEVLLRSHADPRPLLVETAQGTAQALGTWYAVRMQDGRSDISVFEGKVRVQPRQAAQAAIIASGQQAHYGDRSVSPPTPADDTQIAWRQGFIEARSMRLDDFLQELARYSADGLSCDPSVAALRVSGSFPVDQIDTVLESLALTLDLRSERISRFWGSPERRLLPANRAR